MTTPAPTESEPREEASRARPGKLVVLFGTMPLALEVSGRACVRGATRATIERATKRGEDLVVGIEVHELESLVDVVERVTSARTERSVADEILDHADEVFVVDAPPEVIEARAKEIETDALDPRLLRRGALVALRELALRRAAERVDRDVRSFRRGRGIDEPWPLTERVLVSVSSSPGSAAIVRAASRLARETRAEWHAVYVETPLELNLPARDRERAALHLALAESLGAITATRSGERASDALLAYARANDVTKIVVGKTEHSSLRDALFGSFLDEVVRGSGDIDVYAIRGDRAADEPEPRPRRKAPWSAYAKALVVVGIATAIALAVGARVEPANVVMIYLAAVVLVASRWGRGPSVVASLLAVGAFDFFFVPPLYTLAVHDVRSLVTFVVMFLVAVLTSSLTERVRRQAAAARAREERTAALYALSRELASAPGVDRIAEIASRHVRRLVHGEASVVVGAERRDEGGFVVPLTGARGEIGALRIDGALSEELADPVRRRELDVYASQTAVALERAALADEASRAKLEADRERLQSSLLSSVSHDLRTPLAVIQGAATTILETDVSAATQRDLLVSVRDEAERLNRLVTNLLDMTRLESGALKPKKELGSIEEPIGSALVRLEPRLGDRVVETKVPGDLPLVAMDPILVEQVVHNLVDNALKHTPSRSPIEIVASATDRALVVEVRDRGPGLVEGETEHAIRRFAGSGRGAGLGLAICKGMIEAHGGTVALVAREGGGAVARFTLPLGDERASSSEDAVDREAARRGHDIDVRNEP